MIRKSIKDNLYFLVPYILVLLAILPVLLFLSKSAIHLYLNGFHTTGFDWFFKTITWLGNGIFIIGLCLILLIYSLRFPLFILSAYLGSGLIVQVLKRIFFYQIDRPVKYFQHIAQLYLVPGVRILSSHSFPSGHSASSFALFLCLAMMLKSRALKLICFIFACLVAFSRVYLSQHFLVDIYFGSILGVMAAFGFYLVYFHTDKNWYNWRLLDLARHGRNSKK